MKECVIPSSLLFAALFGLELEEDSFLSEEPSFPSLLTFFEDFGRDESV